MMKNSLVLLVALTMSVKLIAQEKIRWTTPQKSEGQVLEIGVKDSTSYFALRRSKDEDRYSKLQVSSHNVAGLESIYKTGIKENLGSKNYKGASQLGENFGLFFTEFDNKSASCNFNVQLFSGGEDESRSVKTLYSYDLAFAKKVDNFTYCISDDKNMIAVIWHTGSMFRYKILNSNFSVMSEGKHDIGFNFFSKSSIYLQENLSHFYLTNSGELYLGAIEATESQNKAAHLIHFSKGEILDNTFDLGKSVYLNGIHVDSDNEGHIAVLGSYAKKVQGQTEAIFYMKVDLVTDELAERGIEEVGFDLSGNFLTRSLRILPDGSMIGFLEEYGDNLTEKAGGESEERQIKIGVNNYSEEKEFLNGDIFFFKIGNGGIVWENLIKRNGVDLSETTYKTSFIQYLNKKNEIVVLLKDNRFCYNEDGYEYKDFEVHSRWLPNLIAQITIDPVDGTYTREKLFDNGDRNINPVLYTVDKLNNQVILYTSYGNEEKFGIMTIEE